MSKPKPKSYVLGMFPYPSGEGLHVGHVRIYTAVDVMARYLRMAGYEVLSPMGWDAFGLPAENAAIKNKVNPQDIVPKNYHNFRGQMERLGFNFDWQHELATTDPTYYGLTQWLFLELYKKGLVVHEEVAINWCPKCKTGLANEEVQADGTHERCGTIVDKKNLPQWVMKITEYADRLLEDLAKAQLDWPRGILEMQRNWIGRKEGVRVRFSPEIEVFTTRVDTIDGVTFIVVAPELVKDWIDAGFNASDKVVTYVQNALQKSEQSRLEGEKEKTGVDTGMRVTNPYNGETVPVWVADYALANVGTGALMAVPYLDERDRDFATKFALPIKTITVDPEAMSVLQKRGVAQVETTYHLRDWVFSRQRYWGEPIPLVHCKDCGVVPLSESELPLTLPYLESYEPTDTGESPLSRVAEWVETKCPRCGGSARRETDTMPNWAGSCWYHLAFAFWQKEGGVKPSKQVATKEILDGYKKKSKTPYSDFWREVARPQIDKWLPVDWYLGGAEHAVLHLLYARFWNKVLLDLGHLGFVEPYTRLRSVGMVLAEDGRKMSKSLGNVINPDDVVAEYGGDAVRLYEMFMGPWGQVTAWDKRAMVGMRRYLERIMDAAKRKITKVADRKFEIELARVVAHTGGAITAQKFNTAIARQMEFVNAWRAAEGGLTRDQVLVFAKILSPFAPSTAQALWEGARGEGKVEESEWPTFDEVESESSMVEVVVQVNGRVRGTVRMTREEASKEGVVVAAARADSRIQKWVEGEVGKVIFVPGRLVNLVV